MGRQRYGNKFSAVQNVREDPWKRKRKERIDNQPPSKLNVDVPGLIFAVLAVVFVVYPLAQWALGR